MAAKNGKYVIGCKLPNGMVIRGAGKQFKLNGANTSQIINGFGITEDVPAEIWDGFLKTHGKTPAVVNGIVFAQGDMASVKDQAKDQEKQKTGLERLDPTKQATKEDKE